ncbi:MAG: PQQ-dependent sugar dehydrogenase, partial [Pseudomonadota bacterium]
MLRSVCTAAVLLLASCSDSGDVTPGPPAPPNTPPVFTSPTAFSVSENTTGLVYTATILDVDSTGVTVSLLSGRDSDFFTFDPATRQVSLDTAADFENPVDTDGDNAYEFQLRLFDGVNETVDTFTMTVTNEIEGIQTTRIASGLDRPIGVAPIPGSNDLIVVLQRGRLIRIDGETGAFVSEILDVSADLSTRGEQGLLGFVTASPDLDPFFVNLTNLAGNTEIRRYGAENSPADPFDLILAVEQPAANHNAGALAIAGDGTLLIPLGDGGGAGDPFATAQDPFTLLGSVLRIIPEGDAFQVDPNRNYTIPDGNPFASGGGAPEVFAIGLRNPFQSFYDPATDALYIGDVGQNTIEEIDIMELASPGANFGWSVREGTAFFSGPDSADFTPPAAEYLHGSG